MAARVDSDVREQVLEDLHLASAGDIHRICDVPRRTASHWQKRPDFPAPRWSTSSGPIWDERDIEKWLDTSRPQVGRPRGSNGATAA